DRQGAGAPGRAEHRPDGATEPDVLDSRRGGGRGEPSRHAQRSGTVHRVRPDQRRVRGGADRTGRHEGPAARRPRAGRHPDLPRGGRRRARRRRRGAAQARSGRDGAGRRVHGRRRSRNHRRPRPRGVAGRHRRRRQQRRDPRDRQGDPAAAVIAATVSRQRNPLTRLVASRSSTRESMMKKLIVATTLSLAALSAQAKDIVETAVGAGKFNTLATALTAAGLVDTLKGKGPFTVFAPTDEAFAKIPKAQLDALLADKAKLTAVLTYHVVPGKVMASDVRAGKVKTLQGSELTIGTAGGVTVDAAQVVATDIVADNGVIHVIDSVVLPN